MKRVEKGVDLSFFFEKKLIATQTTSARETDGCLKGIKDTNNNQTGYMNL